MISVPFFTLTLTLSPQGRGNILQGPSWGDDRGRIPSGCATLSGSFLTGPPREADQGGKGGFSFTGHWSPVTAA
jgi:hypothetical protein